MNIIGIYPGSFQPPHRGNYQAYEYLKKITGNNTFIATTDTVKLPKSPLNFQDKQQIWTRHGVSIDKVVKVKDPYKALEITHRFGNSNTILIFAMSSTDASHILQNTKGYFLPFKSLTDKMEPLNKHAYVLVIPDEYLSINKRIAPFTVSSVFSSKRLTDNQKKSFFKQIFGWYDISLYDLLSKKFSEAGMVENINESMVFRRTLKPFIKEIVKELVSSFSTQNNTTTQTSDEPGQSPEDAVKAARDQAEADRKKSKEDLKQSQLALKTAELNKKAKKQEVDQITRDTVLGLKDKITQLKNKI